MGRWMKPAPLNFLTTQVSHRKYKKKIYVSYVPMWWYNKTKKPIKNLIGLFVY